MLSDFQIMVNGSSPIPYFSDYGTGKFFPRPDLKKVEGFIEYEFLHYFKYNNKYYCGFLGSSWSLLIKPNDYKRMKFIVDEKQRLKERTKEQLSMLFL